MNFSGGRGQLLCVEIHIYVYAIINILNALKILTSCCVHICQYYILSIAKLIISAGPNGNIPQCVLPNCMKPHSIVNMSPEAFHNCERCIVPVSTVMLSNTHIIQYICYEYLCYFLYQQLTILYVVL